MISWGCGGRIIWMPSPAKLRAPMAGTAPGAHSAQVEACAAAPSRTEEASGVFLWPDAPQSMVAWRDIPDRDPGAIAVAWIAGLFVTEPGTAPCRQSGPCAGPSAGAGKTGGWTPGDLLP